MESHTNVSISVCIATGKINMVNREDLVQLTGQVINGMMSADSSILSKLFDRTLHEQAAKVAVSIARDMLKEINS
jgi:hypothetical protein